MESRDIKNRARIVRLMKSGLNASQIARELDLNYKKVSVIYAQEKPEINNSEVK